MRNFAINMEMLQNLKSYIFCFSYDVKQCTKDIRK